MEEEGGASTKEGFREEPGPPVSVRSSYNSSVLFCRCNEGNNQSASWTPADYSHCERRPGLLKELLPLPPSLPLLEKHGSGGGGGAAAAVANANGRSELAGRGLAAPLGLSLGGSPLLQELSELEGQIATIKQQLQAAMKRKRELEQLQSQQQGSPSQPSMHQCSLPTPH